MILSKYRIREACVPEDEKKSLVFPYDEKLVQASSYDLTLGNDFYLCTEEDEIKIEHFSDRNHILTIPPNSICYVITNERLNMSSDLCASISLAFGLIRKGIFLTVQPPIDPGYHGRIVAMLQNLSDSKVEIQQGEHILSIVFQKLTDEIACEDLYSGSYGDISLETFCKSAVRHGSIHGLETSLKQIKEETIEIKNETEKASHENINKIITAITVIIACLTVILTIFTVKDIWKGDPDSQEVVFNENRQVQPETAVEASNNIVQGDSREDAGRGVTLQVGDYEIVISPVSK